MIDIPVPSPGESITQVQIARWLVEDGEPVQKDQELVEIDSDKATFPIASPVDGKVHILIAEGETVNVGSVIATVDEAQGHRGTGAPVTSHEINATPLAKKILHEKQIEAASIAAAFPGKRITRKEIELFIQGKKEAKGEFVFSGARTETRKKLSTLRLKLAERLVSVSFLVRIKELLEEPGRMLTSGQDLYRVLLDI